MKQNFFSVGEEIILQSENYPQHNGEYVVQSMDYNEYADSITGKVDLCWVYNLGFVSDSGSHWWDESALRKKHTPSEDSFTSMMDKLKLGISEEV